MKGEDRSRQLTEGPVIKSLMRLALPMMVGIVAMMAFNLVDTFFVGRLGTLELAAMSFTFPVVLVIHSISRGLGVGATSALSRAIGQGDRQKVRRMTTDALLLSLIVVVIFVTAGLFTIEPLFRVLGADEAVLPLIKKYMFIWYLGMPFVVIPMVGSAAIRATGDTKTPSIIMLAAIAVNLGLDPLLIFGIGPFPRMELAGAALATAIARASVLILSLIVLINRDRMITAERPKLKELLVTWKLVLRLGLPAAATYVIIPLSSGIVTRIIASYGPEAIAGFGVGTRIELFALTVVMAVAMVVIPFIGQNFGARKSGRIRESVRLSQLFSLIWGAFLFVLFLVLGKSIAGLFNENTKVIATASTYLWIVSLSYGTQGIIELNSSAFNALHKPLPAAGLSLLRMIGLYVPLAIAGSQLMDLKGIFGAAAISNIVTALISVIWLRRHLGRLKDEPDNIDSNH